MTSTALADPPILQRPDGALEEVSDVTLASEVKGVSAELDRAAAQRAVDVYGQVLRSQGCGDMVLERHMVEVGLQLVGSSTLRVRIVSEGTAANWKDVAAVTYVMFALEEASGRIVEFCGRPRSECRLWPLPPECIRLT
jgi:hypothetical protein